MLIVLGLWYGGTKGIKFIQRIQKNRLEIKFAWEHPEVVSVLREKYKINHEAVDIIIQQDLMLSPSSGTSAQGKE